MQGTTAAAEPLQLSFVPVDRNPRRLVGSDPMPTRQTHPRTVALHVWILASSVLAWSCVSPNAPPEFATASPEVAKLRVFVESPNVTYTDQDCPKANYTPTRASPNVGRGAADC